MNTINQPHGFAHQGTRVGIMPAKSYQQQKAAGVAMAVKRGKKKAKPGTPSAKMAQMPESSLRHFAKGKKKPKEHP